VIVKNLGLQDYQDILAKMQAFTAIRDDKTPDELWIVQFDSIFTTGISKQDKYPNEINNIPVIKTDRGGQITYHGKGQIVIYLLLDLARLKIGVKKLVNLIEDSIILLLKNLDISAYRRENMPGVYVNNKKIASLGLKVKAGKTYHGLSLNTQMDLLPFNLVDTCGYQNLGVCQISDFTKVEDIDQIANDLSKIIIQNLSA
jgi:lipoyl(octanoyl) transferase